MNDQQPLQALIGDKCVTVLALRVDGKKLSLQLFRQIPVADCVVDDKELASDIRPWGRVKYKITGEGENWLLAERGGQLIRCRIDLPRPSELSETLVQHHLDGIKTLEKDLARVQGTHRGALEKVYRNSLEQHQTELPKAQAALAAAKARHAVFRRLADLPQLFLA